MITLAFDTSFKTASVALMEDNTVLYDLLINLDVNHSEILLPAIDEVCRISKIKIRDVDLFACTLGPGSFTGLRVGVTTMKGLLLATGKPGAGVSSLAALALNVKDHPAMICPVMDAGRSQIYTAGYKFDNGFIIQVLPERIANPLDISCDFAAETIFVGAGAIKYADIIMKPGAEIASDMQQYIRASAVGILGREKYRVNDLLNTDAFVPVYLRPADAKPGKGVFEP